MKLMLFDVLYSKKQKIKIIEKNTSIGLVKYVYITEDILSKMKNKLLLRCFLWYLKTIILKKEKYICVFSTDFKKYEVSLHIKKNENLEFLNIIDTNICKNSLKYLSKINRNSKVIIICNNIENNLLYQYIERFKYVGVYTEYKLKFTNVIAKLQKEYGTEVDIYDSSFVDSVICDIAVYFEDITAPNIKAKKTYFFTKSILDRYSDEYKVYTLYKEEFLEAERYLPKELAISMLYLHNLNQKN